MSAERRLRHRARQARGFPLARLGASLLLVLSALSAAPAQAQSVQVSNAGQTSDATPGIERAAQTFTAGSHPGSYDLTGQVAIDAGYGLGLGASRGVLTPYAGMTFGEASSRTVRTGERWQLGADVAVGVEAAWSESAGADAANEVRLRAAVRF